jgi:hypothetical protein
VSTSNLRRYGIGWDEPECSQMVRRTGDLSVIPKYSGLTTTTANITVTILPHRRYRFGSLHSPLRMQYHSRRTAQLAGSLLTTAYPTFKGGYTLVTLQVTDTIRSYDLNFHPSPHDVTVSCERYTMGFTVCYRRQKHHECKEGERSGRW